MYEDFQSISWYWYSYLNCIPWDIAAEVYDKARCIFAFLYNSLLQGVHCLPPPTVVDDLSDPPHSGVKMVQLARDFLTPLQKAGGLMRSWSRSS